MPDSACSVESIPSDSCSPGGLRRDTDVPRTSEARWARVGVPADGSEPQLRARPRIVRVTPPAATEGSRTAQSGEVERDEERTVPGEEAGALLRAGVAEQAEGDGTEGAGGGASAAGRRGRSVSCCFPGKWRGT